MAAVQIEEDIVVQASAPQVSVPSGPTAGAIKRTVARLLAGRDLSTLSLKALRKEIEERLGVPEGCLTARKDEVRAAASAYMAEQQNASVTVAAPQVANLSESKRVVALATPVDEARKRPAEEGKEIDAGPKKKKQKLSGQRVWQKEHWAEISSELQAANGGVKPGMGAVLSAASPRWKALPQAEKDKYEKQANEANLAAEANGSSVATAKASAPKKPNAGKAAGKGSKKVSGSNESALTRADFQQMSKALQATVSKLNEDGTCGSEMMQSKMHPRVFKSGTVGWFHNQKVTVLLEGGKAVTCQAQVSFMVSGSKNWNDGEGFSADAFAKDSLTSDIGASLDDGAQNEENQTAVDHTNTCSEGAEADPDADTTVATTASAENASSASVDRNAGPQEKSEAVASKETDVESVVGETDVTAQVAPDLASGTLADEKKIDVTEPLTPEVASAASLEEKSSAVPDTSAQQEDVAQE